MTFILILNRIVSDCSFSSCEGVRACVHVEKAVAVRVCIHCIHTVCGDKECVQLLMSVARVHG